ncbi:MAG: choice-of-anchor B family protein [Nocardioidaceae bacterium]|nr:choice-of-anchor B family protein [Nocardioidaceae bacterium]
MIGVVSTVASYAHDDGMGGVHPPGQAQQAHEFENVVASNANEKSNAPRSFAPCIRGMAAKTFPCDGVDMMSHLTLDDLGLSFANDIWGWTDPRTRSEYALIGGTEGTVFVDISDPKRPDIVGTLPSHSNVGNQFWRDIKVYDDHAYVVSEHRDHGMQVFDLTELRGVTGSPVVFSETAHYDDFGSAHNININTDSGYAYAVGTRTCDSGLHMVDINDPSSPTSAGCFSDHGYIHDTQCVIYDGPDTAYQGREICFNSNAEFVGPTIFDIENTLSIVDVTDKGNPVALARVFYENDGYSHQGWLTPDQGYFLHGDELDEVLRGINTTTRIWDVRDLDNPEVIGAYDNGTTSIDHNLYTEADRAYASNYTSGLRIFDTSQVAAGELSEVGFFDVYPENDNASFEGGTWSNYPYYKQKIVAVSSMDRGLFVLKPRGSVGS